jgi:hypothetical protein
MSIAEQGTRVGGGLKASFAPFKFWREDIRSAQQMSLALSWYRERRKQVRHQLSSKFRGILSR